MKINLPFSNKYFFMILLLINGAATYHKISFFAPKSVFRMPYLAVLVLILLSSLVVFDKPWYKYVRWITLGGHAVFHGVFLLSLPIGIVFALTGSYLLALQVLVVFYLPSALALFLNIRALKDMNHKGEMI